MLKSLGLRTKVFSMFHVVCAKKKFSFSLDASVRKSTLDDFDKQSKIVSEYDQEIPQSQTADNPVAPR